eukprot:g2078.t1
MNNTFASLEKEFEEANKKFEALLNVDIEENEYEKLNMLKQLQKAKLIAEAALQNGKFSVQFDDGSELDQTIMVALNALELYLDKLNATNQCLSRNTSENRYDEDTVANITPHSKTSHIDKNEELQDSNRNFEKGKGAPIKISSKDDVIYNLQNELSEKNHIITGLKSEAADRSKLLDACSAEIQRLIARYEELQLCNKILDFYIFTDIKILFN